MDGWMDGWMIIHNILRFQLWIVKKIKSQLFCLFYFIADKSIHTDVFTHICSCHIVEECVYDTAPVEESANVKITLYHSSLQQLSGYPTRAFSHYTTPACFSWITHTRPHRGLGLSNGGGECTWRQEERGRLLFLCWVWQLGGWLGAERKLTPSRHSECWRPTWRPLKVLEPWARPYTYIRHPASVSFTHQHNTCTCLKR